jgi:hypothetical protein
MDRFMIHEPGKFQRHQMGYSTAGVAMQIDFILTPPPADHIHNRSSALPTDIAIRDTP